MTSILTEDGHSYGTTTLLGQASAVLGNSYKGGDAFNIQNATFLLCDTSRNSSLGENTVEKSLATSKGYAREGANIGVLSSSPADRHSLAIPNNSFSTQEITVVAALVCGILAYRNVSPAALLQAIAPIQNDPLLPLLTAALGYWLSNLLHRSPYKTSTTELNGDCIWFEDVYQRRRKVPLTYLEGEHILQGFFRTHYGNSSAVHHIEDQQYNLKIRDRHTHLTTLSALCTSRRLGHDTLVVMSVVFRAKSALCLDCTNKLKLEEDGSFNW